MLAQSHEPEAHDKVLGNSRSNLNLEMLVFEERGKQEDTEKNLSEQRREPTTNSTHIWRRVQESTRDTLVGGERSHYCPVPASLKRTSRQVFRAGVEPGATARETAIDTTAPQNPT